MPDGGKGLCFGRRGSLLEEKVCERKDGRLPSKDAVSTVAAVAGLGS